MINKLTVPIIIRSYIFWIIMVSILPAFCIIVFILYIAPAKFRHKMGIYWSKIFVILAKIICHVNYNVVGKENIINTPAIIASNHQSMWETMGYSCIFPQHIWILKKELLKLPFFGWALSAVSPIAINRNDRKAAIQQILNQSVKRIALGFWIIVFPEGTRIKPKVDAPYKTGVAKMAIALKLPVIPVANNAGYVLPKNSLFLYPGTVEVIIDKPIYPLLNETPEELIQRIKSVINKNLESIQ